MQVYEVRPRKDKLGEPMPYWKAALIVIPMFLLLTMTIAVVIGLAFGKSFTEMMELWLVLLFVSLCGGALMGIGWLLLWIFEACMEKLIGKDEWERHKRQGEIQRPRRRRAIDRESAWHTHEHAGDFKEW